MGQYVVLIIFRSVIFLFLISDFNTFYFLWRIALKTTYLRDHGRFLLKDCLLLLLLLLLLLIVMNDGICRRMFHNLDCATLDGCQGSAFSNVA